MSETTATQVSDKFSGSGVACSARGVQWVVLLFVLGTIVLPDCCLNGRHRVGNGMDAFASICHARP
jgi:hypothetical protein